MLTEKNNKALGLFDYCYINEAPFIPVWSCIHPKFENLSSISLIPFIFKCKRCMIIIYSFFLNHFVLKSVLSWPE